MTCTTVPQIRDFVSKNAHATTLEIAEHFGEYDESFDNVPVMRNGPLGGPTGGPLGRKHYYFIEGVSNEFYRVLQDFISADDVSVKEDPMAWRLQHSQYWGNFKSSVDGTTVHFVPLVFSLTPLSAH